MRGFILGTIATALAFAILTFLLKPNIAYNGEIGGLIVLALIAGVVNGVIKPVVRLLSLPVRVATLGLFSLVINAVMLVLVAWLASLVKLDFSVGGYPPDFSIDTLLWAFVGAIVLSIINTIIGHFVPD
ncbi:MAG: phage holin family protein [Chloroflexota bacterium]